MRNLTIGYLVFVALVISVWLAILPSQQEVLDRLSGTKMVNTIRALESEILTRYGTVDITGNMTHMIYTYHNASVTDWELSGNKTSVLLYFVAGSHIRVKRFGLVIDEYDGPTSNMSMIARLVGETWYLVLNSTKILN